jgi:formylglycine-generating enzyme required for sulfatase activity
MNMRETKMRNTLVVMFAFFCLAAIPPVTHAAKPKASQQTQKERLVLMPLRIPEEDRALQGAMETALVEGLQQKYIVFSGEQVAQKAREIFLKESRNTAKKECDETRCMQGIAEAFQAELLATANVSKQSGSYFLALSVQNIFDNRVEYSKTLTCKNCDAVEVVDKLKELSGAPVQIAAPATQTAEEPQSKLNLNDPETVLWEEVKKGNAAEDYQAYLGQYPKGKFIALAKTKLARLTEEARAAMAQQDQQAWNTAQQTNTQESFASYLDAYPKGQFAALAQGRIDKIKREATAAEAKQKREAAEVAARGPQPDKVFKDCSDCPEMVAIPAGSFDMGLNNGEADEKPVHRVTLAKPFAMGKTEVTQGQWEAVMGNNPSGFKNCGDNCPVENVSWNDAKEFIQKLNSKTGKQYRLPSEAEWEYACRAGGQHEYCGSNDISSVAWYDKNSGSATHAAAQKQVNVFGLYDMSGNVWEWVEDRYHDSYNGALADGSVLPWGGAERVLRGGSWNSVLRNLRSAKRLKYDSVVRVDNGGFRLARTLP